MIYGHVDSSNSRLDPREMKRGDEGLKDGRRMADDFCLFSYFKQLDSGRE